MKSTQLVLAALLALPAAVLAEETGPTHPQPAREHPLDIREPRQDVIESPGNDRPVPQPGRDQALPPTLDRPSTPMDRPAGRSPLPDDSERGASPDSLTD